VRRRLLLVLLTASVVATGCGTTDQGVTAVRSQADTPATPPTPGSDPPVDTTTDTTTTEAPETPVATTDIDPANVIDFGGARQPQPHDEQIAAFLADIETFWSTEYERVYGEPLTPLAGGVHASFADRESPLPDGCGEVTPADIEGNAFYCPTGDYIVYDDDVLVPTLIDQFGPGTLGVVLAHEFGHAVQERAGNLDQPVILAEQQADCFAGAWVAHVARGESADITFSDGDVLDGLVAMIAVRDPVFGTETGADSHGTGFDRVGAFQDGFVGGTDRCTSFFTENRPLVQIPFSLDDLRSNGNLPYAEIVTSIGGDLDRFWADVYASKGRSYTAREVVAGTECDGTPVPLLGYCAADRAVVVNDAAARQLYDTTLPSITEEAVSLGDMSVGYLLSVAYAQAAQAELGVGTAGVDSALTRDCLTGAWARDIIDGGTGDRQISLSPGDLDEAVVTALLTADERTGANDNGGAFDKIDSFRVGVLDGLAACDL
jgi:predicted metalloprotease